MKQLRTLVLAKFKDPTHDPIIIEQKGKKKGATWEGLEAPESCTRAYLRKAQLDGVVRVRVSVGNGEKEFPVATLLALE